MADDWFAVVPRPTTLLGTATTTIGPGGHELLLQAAELVTQKDPRSFALISDLTSFVQVGDLMVFDFEKGVGLVEVKTGEVNRRILDFTHWWMNTQCPAALHHFRQAEGDRTFRHLGRVLRQGARMSAFDSLQRSGSAWDIDTDMQVVVPDKAVELGCYDACLISLFEDSTSKGWAIDHVHECLFLGVYRGDAQRLGPTLFSAWFERCDGRADFPMVNILSCMMTPLALPIFRREISIEAMFDLLFGRASAYLALNLDEFAKLCCAEGLPVRWATRKEAAKIRQACPKAFQPWSGNRNGLVIERNDGLRPVYESIYFRILFHGTTPRSAVKILKEYASIEET